jgi:hypothetical protein
MSEPHADAGGGASKSPLNLPWANIVALLAAAGGIFSLIPGLITSRPPDAGGRAMGVYGDQTVDSRLWQDPFEGVLKDREEKEKARIAAGPEHSFCLTGTGDGAVWVIAVLVQSGPYAEPRERRLRTRAAVIEGLSSSGFAPRDSDHIGYLQSNWDRDSHKLKFDSLPGEGDATLVVPFEWFDRQGEKHADEPNSVVVLWVQEDDCKDAPFTRLAWISNQLGLAGNGLETEARHVRTTVLGPTTSTLLERMVIEAQRMKDDPDKDHDADVRKELRGVSIFCPTATATDEAFNFEGVKREERKKRWDDARESYYANWKAYGTDAAKDAEYKKYQPQEYRDEIEQIINGSLSNWRNTHFSFQRTIATDDDVIWETIKELQRRGIRPKEWVDIDPENPNVTRVAKDENEHENAVALISELDSFYGRVLPATFRSQCTGIPVRKLLGQSVGESLEQTSSKASKKGDDWIYTFHYLRGLDGRLPGDADKKTGDGASGKEEQKQKSGARPSGHDQTDYLLRIAEVIQTADHLRRDTGRRGFRAIGVLGSDVYDKLLILRALRPKFPGVLFFTNNMDAQLTQPEEWEAAHNLVVVSAFGLQLGPLWQQHIPPFRDGYQTAFYLGTLIALHQLDGLKAQLSQLTYPPRVFEIGRNGAFDISDSPRQSDETSIHPQRTDLESWWEMSHWTRLGSLRVWLSILLGILAGGILGVAFFSGAILVRTSADLPWAVRWPSPRLRATLLHWYPQERPGGKFLHRICGSVEGGVSKCINEWFRFSTPFAVLAAAAIAILAALLGHALQSPSVILGEPFAWFSGLSIWPGLAIRIFAIILAMHFVLRSYCEVRRSNREIRDRFLLLADDLKLGALNDEPNQFWNRSLFPWKVDLSPETEAQLQEVSGPGEPSDRGGKASSDVKHGPAAASAPNREISFDARKMWRQYVQRGWWGYRLVRVGAWMLLYAIASFFALAAFDSGFPPEPARGEFAKHFDQISMLAVSVVSIFLTLFIVDALGLNTSFIRVFTRGMTIWPPETIQRSGRQDVLEEREIALGLDMDLIAKRTADVGELVLYPFYIVALLAISRAPYFDDWGWTPGLIVVLGAQLVLAAYSALSMRRAAEKARSAALRELRKSRAFAAAQTDETSRKRVQMLDEVIGEINGLNEGAFAPLSSQPVVRALLYPAGGVGLWELARQTLFQS